MRITKIEHINKGWHKPLLITMKNGKKIVIKDHSFYEKLIYAQLYKSNVPIPKFILNLRPTFLYLSYIEGKQLYMLNLFQINKAQIFYLLGRNLANIHKQHPLATKILHYIWDIDISIPKTDVNNVVKQVMYYLKTIVPIDSKLSFIHGDYHLGNILFDNEQIIILDWEFSGYGKKEADMAWSITVREDCMIYSQITHLRDFIQGYEEIGSFSRRNLKYYLSKCYLFFYAKAVNEHNVCYQNMLLCCMENIVLKGIL